ARLRMAGVHSSFPSERPSRLSSLWPSQLRSDFKRLPLPPNTLTSSYYFRHSNKHAVKNKFAGSQAQWKGCFAFVLLRMMQTGDETVQGFPPVPLLAPFIEPPPPPHKTLP